MAYSGTMYLYSRSIDFELCGVVGYSEVNALASLFPIGRPILVAESCSFLFQRRLHFHRNLVIHCRTITSHLVLPNEYLRRHCIPFVWEL